MQAHQVAKYGFRIRTRGGMLVENLMIPARDDVEAHRKLRQIYRDCVILDCVCVRGTVRTPVTSFEDVVNLITR
jgi:hypothetical protein